MTAPAAPSPASPSPSPSFPLPSTAPLPAPGSPNFVPQLVSHAHTHLSPQWDFDTALFSALLLALIVGSGRGGVVVDVLKSEGGIREEVGKVAGAVQGLTEGIFGLTTHSAHFSSGSTPDQVPYKLLISPPSRADEFLKPGASASGVAAVGVRETRSLSDPRSTRAGQIGDGVGVGHGDEGGDEGEGGGGNNAEEGFAGRQEMLVDSPERIGGRGSPPYTPRRGATPRGSASGNASGSAHRSGESPAPNRSPSRSQSHSRSRSQSRSRLRRLTNPRLQADALIPSHESSPSSRPKPTLAPEVLILSGLERCESAVWVKLCEVLVTRKIRLAGDVYPGGPTRSDDPSEREQGAEEAGAELADDVGGSGGSQEWDLADCLVVWVRDEEESERCSSWLIDQFACGVVVHPDDIEPAPALPRRDIVSQRYLTNLRHLLPYTHIHPPLSIHLSNLLSAVSHHPRLKTTLTSRATTCFPDFVRAHRLLSSPFSLPDGWEAAIQLRTVALRGEGGEGFGGKLGLGGGRGGVDTWGCLAGEEPSARDLMWSADSVYGNGNGKRGEMGNGQGNGIGNGTSKIRGNDNVVEDWYASPENVRGIWSLALRHRVSWRDERGEVMWLLKGNAAGLFGEDRRASKSANGDTATGDGKGRGKARERRRRREVDLIMEEIFRVV